VSRSYLSRLFKSWRWSFHFPNHEQLQKYEPDNVQYYIEFFFGLRELSWKKLKFFDESSYCPRQLAKRKILGPRNQPRTVQRRQNLNEPSLTTSVLLCPKNKESPVKLNIKEGTNNAFDFLDNIITFTQLGYLSAGDYLILDNARIHCSREIWPYLTNFLDQASINLLFMPKYSPELNPCELVHAKAKHFIRNNSLLNVSLQEKILFAHSQVSYHNIKNFYKHCFQD